LQRREAGAGQALRWRDGMKITARQHAHRRKLRLAAKVAGGVLHPRILTTACDGVDRAGLWRFGVTIDALFLKSDKRLRMLSGCPMYIASFAAYIT